MKRFRITLLVVCIYLLYLGGVDLALTLQNPEPKPITVDQLITQGAPQDWLTIEGGTLHLLDAVSTSGELKIEALLVPIHRGREKGPVQILLETRDPELIKAFSTYYILLETEAQKATFAAENTDLIYQTSTRTGLMTTGLVAENNRSRMLKLAKQIGLDVDPEVIFLSEGKTPHTWRGLFYLLVGLAGFFKVLSSWQKGPKNPSVSTPS